MAEITLTSDNFQAEVLDSPLPVLVDFWATWCGPCRMVAPIVAEIAAEKAGVIKVGKVNVDEEPGLAGRYGISSIPTLMLFKNGQLVDTMVGARTKAKIEQMLKCVSNEIRFAGMRRRKLRIIRPDRERLVSFAPLLLLSQQHFHAVGSK